MFPSLFDPTHRNGVVRGPEPVPISKAETLAGGGDSPTVPVVGVSIPEEQLYRGVTVQGAMGSGKSLFVLTLVLHWLRKMTQPFSKAKLVVIDVNQDLTSKVLGLFRAVCPAVPLYLLNPFDRFGHALDPREFSRGPTAVTQLVRALTYRKRDARTDDFFDTSARTHLAELVNTLSRRVPGRWSWRTLHQIGTSYDLLLRVLKNSKTGRSKAQKAVKRTFSGVVSTIEAWLDEFQAAFACWEKSPPLSLKKFLDGPGILILTMPENQTDTISPLARLVLRYLKDELLTANGRDPASSALLVFDEFADLHGVGEVIYPFYGRARSARVAVVTAWQSWPAVCVGHDERVMRGILDNAAIRVWLKAGEESAETASRYCGAGEYRRWEESITPGRDLGRTVSSKHEMRKAVLPGEFTTLSVPTRHDPTVRGFITVPQVPGPVFFEQDVGPFIDLLNSLPKIPAIRERPVSDHFLKPWDDVTDGDALETLFTKEI